MTAQLSINAELLQCEDGSGWKIQYYLGKHIIPFFDPVPVFDGALAPKQEHVTYIASRKMEELQKFFNDVHMEISIKDDVIEGTLN